MTRLSSPIGGALALAVGAIFVIALIATMPLSVVLRAASLEQHGVSVSRIDGTIWRGQLHNVSARDVNFGDIELRLDPLSVIAFAPRMRINAARGDVVGGGDVSISIARNTRLDNVRLNVAAPAITTQRIFGAAPSGSVRLTIDKARLSPAGCAEASGAIATDMLNEVAVRYSGSAFPVSGGITCVDGVIRLSLFGDGASGRANIDLQIRPDRTYVVKVVAHPADQELLSALLFFGFEQSDDSLVYGSTGIVEGVGI